MMKISMLLRSPAGTYKIEEELLNPNWKTQGLQILQWGYTSGNT